jgi:hypothetical protein
VLLIQRKTVAQLTIKTDYKCKEEIFMKETEQFH